MTNAVMKRVCNRKSYRESRELPVRMPQCAAERDRWNVTEDGFLSGVDEHGKMQVHEGLRPLQRRGGVMTSPAETVGCETDSEWKW